MSCTNKSQGGCLAQATESCHYIHQLRVTFHLLRPGSMLDFRVGGLQLVLTEALCQLADSPASHAQPWYPQPLRNSPVFICRCVSFCRQFVDWDHPYGGCSSDLYRIQLTVTCLQRTVKQMCDTAATQINMLYPRNTSVQRTVAVLLVMRALHHDRPRHCHTGTTVKLQSLALLLEITLKYHC